MRCGFRPVWLWSILRGVKANTSVPKLGTLDPLVHGCKWQDPYERGFPVLELGTRTKRMNRCLRMQKNEIVFVEAACRSGCFSACRSG